MSMRKFLRAAAPAALFALASPRSPSRAPTSAGDLGGRPCRLDISVGPDGAGLPPGSGTVKQGEAVFMRSARPATARRAPARRTTAWSAARARCRATSRP